LQYDRIIKLRGKKTVSQSAFDEIQARRGNARETVETAKANIHVTEAQLQKVIAQKKGARASISERQASVKLAKIRLAYCTIRSPIDGVVIERAVDVGQTVAASLQSPILFTIAEDLTRMPLAVDVSEADVGQIQSGQEVEFSVDVFAEKKFKASVQQIRNSPTSIQNVVTYKVIADVDNSSGLLRPGMTANVSIIVAHRNGVLMVPNAALRFRPPGVRQKTQAKKPSSIKERPIYKRTVENLKLDEDQAAELETILAEAGGKLKNALKDAGDEDEKKQRFRDFYTHVFTRLSRILTEPQRVKLRAYVQALKATKGKSKGRQAQVFVVDPDGRPEAVQIWIGITNDSETEVKSENLKEGTRVIIGLSASRGPEQKKSTNALMRILSGRRH
jgi:HlyD family secretion protein